MIFECFSEINPLQTFLIYKNKCSPVVIVPPQKAYKSIYTSFKIFACMHKTENDNTTR